MKTAFETGPGFFAADSSEYDKTLPPRTLRVYCARLEAYDLTSQGDGSEINFEVLFAKCEDDPRLAKALLKLGEAITENLETLQGFLKEIRPE